MKKHVWTLALVTILVAESATAIPSSAGAEERVAGWTTTTGSSAPGLPAIVSDIGRTFREPISFEYSLVNEDRSQASFENVSFQIKKGETLASVLDRFCLATGNRFQWGRIRGVVWVWPAEGKGIVDPTLDVKVTLKLRAASTWHAMLELSRAVNATTPHGRYLRPAPAGAGDNGNVPIESLRDLRTISLDLADVTAREALCAIVAASPLRLRLTYATYYSPRARSLWPLAVASVWVYDENYELLFSRKMEVEGNHDELIRWMNEMNSVIPPRPETPAAAPESKKTEE